MGSGTYSPSDWRAYASKTKHKRAEEVFRSNTLDKDVDPRNVKVRESRDSANHPASTAIIIALDQTGSMNSVLERIVRKDLGVAFEEIINRRPVNDPQIMLMTFDDAHYIQDGCLQVSQFESETNPLTEQIDKTWLTNYGGGNASESYHLPLYFAATRTSIDCFEKRGKKGYLFTIGDEETPPALTRDQIAAIIGDSVEADFSYEDCLRMAEKMYHVFHVMVAEGSHFRYAGDTVKKKWSQVLGERALLLTDHSKLGEVIVSAIQITEGALVDDVVNSWSGDTAVAVREATKGLTTSTGDGRAEVVSL